MKNPVKFGKYYLLERINVGGMAEVFKAKSFGEAGFERLVAVKRVLPSIAEDQEFISMFIDEAKLAVQLTHPNIAQIFELGKVGEAYFIALEYVPGKDLRAIFDRGRKRGEPLPIPMACYMVMKICEGLDYAHNKKDAAGRNIELVHRDVSPQNMLISYEGDVKLIDFGIAKAASKSSRTQAGILKGKFGYMSPEQVRGLQIDRRSDIFSVGICLYELLTMERLFVGESDFSTLEKVRNVEIMPPSTYNRKIPEELEQIVLKALAKHPEDRYRTAMDLHDDLQSFMYTSGNFFARKDLSAYMHRIFQDEIAKEASKDDEYRKFDSRRASDLDVFDNAAAPAGRGSLNAPPPPPRASAPPPPPPAAAAAVHNQRGLRSTMMGVGLSPAVLAAAQQPPTARASVPPPVPGAQKSMVGGAAAGPATGNPAIDMDWDDEELATQVYDKPEPPMPPARGVSMPPPVPPSNRPLTSTSNPAMPAMSAAPAMLGSQFAGPRQPTAPMPAVMAGPSRSLPAIPAPGPGPAMNGYGQQPGMMGPGGGAAAAAPAMYPPPGMAPAPGMSGPMPIPMGGGQGPSGMYMPPPGAPYQMGGAGGPPMNGGPVMMGPNAQFSMDRQITLAAPPPERPKRSAAVFALAGLGVIAVAAAMVVGLRLFSRATSHGTPVADVPTQPVVPAPLPVAVNPTPAVAPPTALAAPGPVAAGAEPVQPTGALAPPVVPAAVPVPAPTAPVAPQPEPQPDRPAAVAAVPTVPVVHHHYPSPPREVQTAAASEPTPPRASHTEPAAATGGGSAGTGLLSIMTRPASRCTIAGQTFSVPRIGLELPAGSYRITCQNSDFNVSATWSVTIRAGQTTLERGHQLN